MALLLSHGHGMTLHMSNTKTCVFEYWGLGMVVSHFAQANKMCRHFLIDLQPENLLKE